MRCANATELYWAMRSEVERGSLSVCFDPQSPKHGKRLRQAKPSRSFELASVNHNIAGFRDVNMRWAWASVLQFFAETEEAGWLKSYNKHADRFLDGDRWIGAYGPLALPGLREGIGRLVRDRASTRAVSSLHERDRDDLNRPACISTLQLIVDEGRLNLCAYQRSLHLSGVMPYDCLLLTNVLHWACWRLRQFTDPIEPGSVYWTVGSLHDVAEIYETTNLPRHRGLLVDPSLLDDAVRCRDELVRNAAAAAQGVA